MINLQKDISTGKYIVMLNASTNRHTTCLRKHYLTNLCGFKKFVEFRDLNFGIAFHIFAKRLPEVTSLSNIAVAINPAISYFKETPSLDKSNKTFLTPEYLMEVCLAYYKEVYTKDNFQILRDKDNNPLVEQTFAIKICESETAIYLLCGTIDKIGKVGTNGAYVIRDYKTTGNYKSEDFFTKYLLSHQLLTYLYAIKELGMLYPNGLLGEISKTQVGVQIESIHVPSSVKINFDKSPVMFYDLDRLIEYRRVLEELILVIDMHLKAEKLPIRQGLFNGECQGNYGSLCMFYSACNAPDMTAFEMILKNKFKQESYDPLKEKE